VYTVAREDSSRTAPPSSRHRVLAAGLLDGLGDRGDQDRVRGALDKHLMPAADQVRDGLLEMHRGAQAVVPVPGAGAAGPLPGTTLALAQVLAGHRGDHRDTRPARLETVQGGQDLLLELFHLRPV
jgi:hypothetical protein